AIVIDAKSLENKHFILQTNEKARELHEIRCIETNQNRNQLTFALRTKGKALSGKLQALENVSGLKCCNNYCVKVCYLSYHTPAH
ncbi:hypothetical protein MXB_447, partial [Myxobolus squamalis]